VGLGETQQEARRSFPTGDQNPPAQASLINRLADSTERIEPALTTLAIVQEVSHCFLDQLIGVPISAASELLLDLPCQIRRQPDVHGWSLTSLYAFIIHAAAPVQVVR
jgi:hypothetical protein